MARQHLNVQVRAEATEWLLRFSEGEVDASTRQEFKRWLCTSPEHVRAYLRIAAFWQVAAHIGGKDATRDIDALVARAKLEGNVFPLEFCPRPKREELAAPSNPASSQRDAAESASVEAHRPRSEPFHRRRFLHRLAAAVLLVIGAITAYEWQRGVYVTDTGERQSVNLPDGSIVTINARSRIAVRYTDSQRVIELHEGQALFRVAKNPERPFVVRTGNASVTAVGTQFDVYRRSTGTTVTVVEGKVAVRRSASMLTSLFSRERSGRYDSEGSPRSGASSDRGYPHTGSGDAGSTTSQQETAPENSRRSPVPSRDAVLYLSAGQQVTVAVEAPTISVSGAQTPAVRTADVATATAWTTGVLVFDSAALSEVVQEFNRQNSKQLVLSDPELRSLKISGTFPANGSDRLVRFLKQRFGVAVHETSDQISIHRHAVEDHGPLQKGG